MAKLWKKNKKYFLFALVIIVIGIGGGIIYHHLQSAIIKEEIINTLSNYGNFRYNAILKDLIIMALLLVFAFLIIGLPLGMFYLFYEGVTIGFLISIFMATFKVKGLLYIILYLLSNKMITLIIMIFFIKKIINIARYSLGLIIYKNDSTIREKIVKNFCSGLKYIIVVFGVNILLYFTSAIILPKLSFLLK